MLTTSEIARITAWFQERFAARNSSGKEDESSHLLSVVQAVSNAGPIEHGPQVAAVVEVALTQDPARFIDLMTDNINALLALGLLPRLSPRFLTSPFCEWAYVLDFGASELVVGTGVEENSAAAKEGNPNVWLPLDTADMQVYAKFPLDKIPQDWERQVAAYVD